MNNEEKEVKRRTTPKKKTTKKTETKKTTTKSNEIKKTTTKATTKKTEEKKTVAKKESKPKKIEKKEEVKIISETKEIKEEPKVISKESKAVTKDTKEAEVSKEVLAIRKKRYIIEAIIVITLVIIALIILCNRTFLKTSYVNDNITVSIPRFSYFVSDNNNTVKLVTLRKASYLRDYFNEYLEGFTFYSCSEGTNTFYYNEGTHSLIREIKIESNFGIKTIEITYETRSPEEVCGLM